MGTEDLVKALRATRREALDHVARINELICYIERKEEIAGAINRACELLEKKKRDEK